MFKKIYLKKSKNYIYITLIFIIIFQQIFIIILLGNYIFKKNNNDTLNNLFIKKKLNNNYTIIEKIKLDYENSNFAILKRTSCRTCGLFSNYIVYLGCIRQYISEGYIPLIDLGSFRNIFNGFNKSSTYNPWEIFFYQPFNHTLIKVLKFAKNIKYFICKSTFYRPYNTIYINKVLINYWHNIASLYMPIKEEFINKSNYLFQKLFNNNNNILGVLIRGTDYIAKKPKHHPIPPNVETMINDVKTMDKKNNYNINYNYNSKLLLAYNKNIKGNIEFMKIYLINIILLSKCIDIITARTSGAAGAFIITNGFRNEKIYFLGKF